MTPFSPKPHLFGLVWFWEVGDIIVVVLFSPKFIFSSWYISKVRLTLRVLIQTVM